MKPYLVVAVGAMVNAKMESNILDIGKGGGSIPTTSFDLYFFLIYSILITLFHRYLSGEIGV